MCQKLNAFGNTVHFSRPNGTGVLRSTRVFLSKRASTTTTNIMKENLGRETKVFTVQILYRHLVTVHTDNTSLSSKFFTERARTPQNDLETTFRHRKKIIFWKVLVSAYL